MAALGLGPAGSLHHVMTMKRVDLASAAQFLNMASSLTGVLLVFGGITTWAGAVKQAGAVKPA
ncbi:hypothetical protein DPM13_01870 [Paracoccus mutanolyticus]|uniref:Uncharacterized protein n=1 Tax=Paracoccus mutanolyticus TaxID=1499308 RepID=A0ABN5M4B7_9RHOB|nr:hypothetical protein DPM13_01870 [Paracoccus mutanolyticus]